MSSVKLNCPDGVIIAKEIKGYENLYFATSNGQIWSCKRKQYLDQVPDQKGYLHVVLYKDGESKRCCVHRLVLSAFVPQPKDKDQVNHIDGNKQNNNLNNLEWVTNQENVQHALMYAINELIPEENIPPGARNNVFGWMVNKGRELKEEHQ